jgi:amino acid transporter
MSDKLKANSLSFFESLVMGVAGSAPGFSIAVAISGLLGTAGFASPNAVLIFALPMLGIALAYKGLNGKFANAGAAYEWTKIAFGPVFGFFSGWALLFASMVFMVTGSVPLGTATLDLIDPSLASHVLLTTGIGAVWFLAIAAVLIAGIEITSRVQVIMSSIELLILFGISIAAFVRTATGQTIHPFSWSWFGFHYSGATFASSALIVVFLYWGWDVTANLSEETRNERPNAAGNGGLLSVFVTIASFAAFTAATLMLFSLHDASGFSDNLIYHVAVAAGLGKAGGYAAALALILSSIATLETTMLQFSRTLFAMGRDRALPGFFGEVHLRTLALGLAVIFASSFMPSIGSILTDSVNAIAVQVSYYYGLAGLVCAWLYRESYRESLATFLQFALAPGLSALALITLGIYAISTFDTTTRIVGIGGLIAGTLFFRPGGYRRVAAAAPVP